MLETIAAWMLAILWMLPLLYAVWTAFHPSEYSARFELLAPVTLDNFARAWGAAPFRAFLAALAEHEIADRGRRRCSCPSEGNR